MILEGVVVFIWFDDVCTVLGVQVGVWPRTTKASASSVETLRTLKGTSTETGALTNLKTATTKYR